MRTKRASDDLQSDALKHKIFASKASKISTLAMTKTLGNLKKQQKQKIHDDKKDKKNG